MENPPPPPSPLQDMAQNNDMVEKSFKQSVSIMSTISGPSVSVSSMNSNGSSTSASALTLHEPYKHDVSGEKSSSSTSDDLDSNETISRTSFCPSKPHKGNDMRWELIQKLKMKDGDLRLAHFRLLKKLGCGDIGSVYLAELRGTGCLFAMKVMDKGMLVGRKKLLRAQTERDILGLLDHPFLPTLYSHFETDKFSCLLMEFCNGGDLHTLRQHQPGKYFLEQATRFYGSQVLVALEYLHMMGVIYRDLKPENVLVRDDGHIMLSDFDLSLRCFVNPTLVHQSTPRSTTGPTSGETSYCIQPSCIALDSSCKLPLHCVQPSCFTPHFLVNTSKKSTKKRHDHRPSGSGSSSSHLLHSFPEIIVEPTTVRSMSFVGTHEYLAPEIVRGDGHGSAVDWWTFGIFLYELLHGKTPFKGNGNRETLCNVANKGLKFPEGSDHQHHNHNVSFAAKDLIRGLLVKDPKKRLGFKRGAVEIKQHAFFQGVNWPLIRTTNPPHIPKPLDISIFNPNLNPSANAHVSRSEHKSAANSSHSHSRSHSHSSSGSYLDFEFF